MTSVFLAPCDAADHAAPAQLAAGAVGSLAAEVGVGDGLARLAEEDARRASFCRCRRRRAPRRARAAAGRPGRRAGSARRRASAAPRRSGARAPPPSPAISRPLAVLEERLRRDVERVGVAEAAAADAAAGDDRDVLEGRQPEDPLHAQPRVPEVALQVRRRARELVVGEAPPALEHADRVALLGQAQRRDAAAEARADHQPVEVEAVLTSRPCRQSPLLDASARRS